MYANHCETDDGLGNISMPLAIVALLWILDCIWGSVAYHRIVYTTTQCPCWSCSLGPQVQNHPPTHFPSVPSLHENTYTMPFLSSVCFASLVNKMQILCLRRTDRNSPEKCDRGQVINECGIFPSRYPEDYSFGFTHCEASKSYYAARLESRCFSQWAKTNCQSFVRLS